MKHLPLLLLCLPCPASSQEKPGAITGTVRFLGTIPPDVKVLATDGTPLVLNDLAVEPKTKGLRYVVVHLEKAPPHKAAPRRDKVIIDQLDMLFTPRVVAIQEGQTVSFENSDGCNHGVRANSGLMANTFNISTPPSMRFPFEFKAQKPPIVIDCPIHAWMKAYVFAFDHPFFAVTDARGQFRISGIPPGKHTLVLRHPETGTREARAFTVEPGETLEVNVDWKTTGKSGI